MSQIEIYGIRGLKSKSFRKVFPNEKAMIKWCEDHEGDVRVHGTRLLGKEGAIIPSDMGLRRWEDLPRLPKRGSDS